MITPCVQLLDAAMRISVTEVSVRTIRDYQWLHKWVAQALDVGPLRFKVIQLPLIELEFHTKVKGFCLAEGTIRHAVRPETHITNRELGAKVH